MVNTQVIRIDTINFDEKLYPRTKWDWFTVNDYKNSMKTGAVFPPIEVALFKKKFYLIDGRHRIEARKQLKDEYISAIVHKNLNQKQIFVKAIQSNIIHGRPLSFQDKMMVVDKLQKLSFSMKDIVRLVNIPADKITKFSIERVTNTISGETVYLKATTKNFAGQSVPDDFEDMQEPFSTRGQLSLLRQTVSLFQDGLVDFNDREIVKEVVKLKSIVQSLKIPLIK